MLAAGAWLARAGLLAEPASRYRPGRLVRGRSRPAAGVRCPRRRRPARLASWRWRRRSSARGGSWWVRSPPTSWPRSGAARTPSSSSASSSRRTSRRRKRRSSSTTSRPRARRSRSMTSSERQLSGDALLSRADIERNAATLENVPLWDHQPLLDTFGQIQEIRTYYDFVSVHNDRYIDRRQVPPGHALGPRAELAPACPTARGSTSGSRSRTATASRSARSTRSPREGLPVLFIKNLPPEIVGRPRGRRAEHLLRRALERPRLRARPTRASSTTRRATTTSSRPTTATGGVPVGGFLRKALFAHPVPVAQARCSATTHAREPRAVLPARAASACERIAPFLTYENDRYLSIADGRLYWVQDAYTVSGRYPYSTPARAGRSTTSATRSRSTVDAYHGTTTFYLVDDKDPIAQTLAQDLPRPAAAAVARCPRGCARGCATRRASSRCRRRCSRPTT